MTHTPGPWKVSHHHRIDAGGQFEYLPATNGKGAPQCVWEANARLIAAAPDMLAALKELWEQVGKTGWHNADPIHSRRHQRAELLNRARAAIAKAEGKQ